MHTIKRLATLAVGIAAVTALTETSASATGADRTVMPLNFTVPSPGLSQLCGTPISISVAGTSVVSIISTGSGAATEVDTNPDLKITFTATDTGRTSSSALSGPAITDYPDGIYIGAPATYRALGLHQKVDGTAADAGQTVFDGAVVFVTPDGFPIVATADQPTKADGHINDPTLVLAALCTALAG